MQHICNFVRFFVFNNNKNMTLKSTKNIKNKKHKNMFLKLL